VYYSVVLFALHQLLDGAAQLVGARGGLAVATDVVEAGNNILVFHSLYQFADALQVAVAASVEGYVYYTSVFACHFYQL
jgi:hypothetical protein